MRDLPERPTDGQCARESDPRAVQSSRLRDGALGRLRLSGRVQRTRPLSRKRRDNGDRTMNRRAFLADVGMGFTGLALGALLARDGVARAADSAWSPPDGKPHFPPKAKNVIWLFMVGGASHVEGFDPKPALNQYAGKTIAESPFKEALNSPFLKKTVRD